MPKHTAEYQVVIMLVYLQQSRYQGQQHPQSPEGAFVAEERSLKELFGILYQFHALSVLVLLLCLNTHRSSTKLVGTAIISTKIGAMSRGTPICKNALNRNMCSK